MSQLIGRTHEFQQLSTCLRLEKNTLLEGPVGVGKTHLALQVIQSLGVPVFRVDGDSRYTEQKLTGWFDPPSVIQKGYSEETFIPGPLVSAMREGGVLFINELNRLPEGVQNVLLPAIDERLVLVPRLGEIRAKKGFKVVATQNPKEFVATSHLSEAILDRFELVVLDYQTEDEEIAIVKAHVPEATADLARLATRLMRMTREDPQVRRGASVRAAMSLAAIAQSIGGGQKDAFLQAALLAVPTRIELERENDSDRTVHGEMEAFIRRLVDAVFGGGAGSVKKKN